MSVDDFKKQVEQEYLAVRNMEIEKIEDYNTNFGISTYSSGLKIQNCLFYNNKGVRIGGVYMTAMVVEAGVNQYTSIRSFGVNTYLGDSTSFYINSVSYALSNGDKTCTVTYNGWFEDMNMVVLTTLRTYRVPYQANGGDLWMQLTTTI